MDIKVKSVSFDSVGICFEAKIELLNELYSIRITEHVAKQLIHEASRADKLEIESNGTGIFYYFI